MRLRGEGRRLLAVAEAAVGRLADNVHIGRHDAADALLDRAHARAAKVRVGPVLAALRHHRALRLAAAIVAQPLRRRVLVPLARVQNRRTVAQLGVRLRAHDAAAVALGAGDGRVARIRAADEVVDAISVSPSLHEARLAALDDGEVRTRALLRQKVGKRVRRASDIPALKQHLAHPTAVRQGWEANANVVVDDRLAAVAARVPRVAYARAILVVLVDWQPANVVAHALWRVAAAVASVGHVAPRAIAGLECGGERRPKVGVAGHLAHQLLLPRRHQIPRGQDLGTAPRELQLSPIAARVIVGWPLRKLGHPVDADRFAERLEDRLEHSVRIAALLSQ